MKRCNSSLYAIAVAAGAGMLFAVPALAQATNSDGYQVYTQNFDGTTTTPTGTSGGPGKATVVAGNTAVINAPRTADYDYAVQDANSTVTIKGTTQTVGGDVVTNQADSGTQAANVYWQYSNSNNTNGTTSGPGFFGYTSASTTGFPSLNNRPTVDLASFVNLNMYVEAYTANGVVDPNAQVEVQLELEGNTTEYYNADTATNVLTQVGASPTTTQPDLLGMKGLDGPGTDLYVLGATPSNGSNGGATGGITLGGGFPTGGKPVSSGSFQNVTFNLATDPATLVVDTTGVGIRRSGLGSLYGIDFTPVNPANGEVYSVYIDDLTIGAAPEPSAWLGLAAGGAMLLGLGLVSARRRRGAAAA